MRSTPLFTTLRWEAKRIVRKPGLRWLSGPARVAWYWVRSANELRYLPLVLGRITKRTRAQRIEELVELVFTGFNGMFRPFQNRAELERLLKRVRSLQARVIIEIGTARGGTLFLLSCVADPEAQLISIDLPAGLYGGGYPAWKGRLYTRIVGQHQRLTLIRGDSHKDATFSKAVAALEGAPADLLFIDGDHSYAGAKHDYLRYRNLVRPGGLIIFHDVLDNTLDSNITVAPLWKEIASSYPTEEIVESYTQAQFGIGVLPVPERW